MNANTHSAPLPTRPDTLAPEVFADDLCAYIAASPTPWHAVDEALQRLLTLGFKPLTLAARWQLQDGGRYVLVQNSALIAFVLGKKNPADHGITLLGAHTDSPTLRLKTRPAIDNGGVLSLAVDMYGGATLASFADRDLSLAGRVIDRQLQVHLVDFAFPMLRLANLPIHFNRQANEQGVKFNLQNELPLIMGMRHEQDVQAYFLQRLAEMSGVAAPDILGFELNAYDTQKPALWGMEREFIAARQLDNLAACHAALSALAGYTGQGKTGVVALLEHEEIGSGSAGGAGGRLLDEVLARIGDTNALDRQDRQRARHASCLLSVDAAHAWHPNFPHCFEPNHRLLVNRGPAIKINANGRYATDMVSAARLRRLCEEHELPYQEFINRGDMGCGSTIGPILNARLGIPTVDLGSPLWAMHSCRESAGVLDHYSLRKILATVLTA